MPPVSDPSQPDPSAPPARPRDPGKIDQLAALAASQGPLDVRSRAVILLGRVISPGEAGPIGVLRKLATQTEIPDLAFHARRALDEVRRRALAAGARPQTATASGVPADVLHALAEEKDETVLFPLIDRCVVSPRPEYLAILLRRLRKETNLRVLSKLTKNIGLFGEEAIFDELCRYLEHPDSRVRANTIEGLGGLRTEERFKRVLPLLRDPDNRVRANAVRLLRDYREGDPLQLLADMLASPQVSYRASALFVLSKFRSPAADELARKAMADADPGIRVQAAEVLVEMGELDGLDYIAQLLRSGAEDAGSLALAALKRLQDRAPDALRPRVDELIGEWFEARYAIPQAAPATHAGVPVPAPQAEDARLMAQIDGLLSGPAVAPTRAEAPAAAGPAATGAPEPSHSPQSLAPPAPVAPPTPSTSEVGRGFTAQTPSPQSQPRPAATASPPAGQDETPASRAAAPADPPAPAAAKGDVTPRAKRKEAGKGGARAGRSPGARPAGSPPETPPAAPAEATEFDDLSQSELGARFDELLARAPEEARKALERAARSGVAEVRAEARKRLTGLAAPDARKGTDRKRLALIAGIVVVVAAALGLSLFLWSRGGTMPSPSAGDSGAPPDETSAPPPAVTTAPPSVLPPTPPAPPVGLPATPPSTSAQLPPAPPVTATIATLTPTVPPAIPVPPTSTAPAVTVPVTPAVPPVVPVVSLPVTPQVTAAPAAASTSAAVPATASAQPAAVPASAAVAVSLPPPVAQPTAPGSSRLIVRDVPFDEFACIPGQEAYVLGLTHSFAATAPVTAAWLPRREIALVVPGRDAVRELTTAGGNSMPAPSPDGRRILFLRSEQGLANLFGMNLDGSGLQAVTDGLSCGKVSFSPGGNRMVAEVLNLDEAGRMVASNLAIIDLMTAKGIGARDLFVGHGGRYLTTDGKAAFPAWHPKFARVAFGTLAGASPGKVSVVGADGQGQKDFAVDGQVAAVAWCPTGQFLGAMVEKGGQTKLLVCEPDAKAEWRTVLGDGPGDGSLGAFDWSPDGQEIVCVSAPQPGRAGKLLLVKVKTGERRVLSADPAYTSVRFLPDGKRLVARREGQPPRAAVEELGL